MAESRIHPRFRRRGRFAAIRPDLAPGTGTALATLGGLTATVGAGADVPTDDVPQDDTPGTGLAVLISTPGSAAAPLGRLTAAAVGGLLWIGTATAPLGRLTAIAIGIVSGPLPLVLPRRKTLDYEVIVVARVPAASGPPTFLIVDPIQWTSLEWTRELSTPQTLNVTCSISSLTEPIMQRLRQPAALATELWLYRGGQRVFAGPLTGGHRDGETLSLHADGLLSYLARMIVYNDLVFSQADQGSMVKTFVDQWQDVSYGHCGIDTGAVATTGVLRDGTYLKTELHPVLQRVQELGKREHGFDVDVDPASRQLQIWYPTRGVDRSTGEDAVVFDARNITKASTMFSVGPSDVATIAFGTGTSNDATAGTLYSTLYNAELLPQYGLSGVTATWDSVKEQATLDEHVSAMLLARRQALFVPGPDIRVTPDADLSTYDVGDTVHCDIDDQLGVTGAFRLRSLKVGVDATGKELVTPTFV